MAAALSGSAVTTRRTRRERARHWRRTRPFWGALLVILGGAEILASVRAPLPVILHVGLQGMAGYLVPVVLLTCGVLLLFSPAQRIFYAIVAIILALASWLTSNLGGFLVGMVLALVGGCLALAWAPRRPGPAGRHAAGPAERSATTADSPASTADQPTAVDQPTTAGRPGAAAGPPATTEVFPPGP